MTAIEFHQQELRQEAAKRKLVIDRTCFKKTEAEKALVKTLKSNLTKTRTYKFKTLLKAAF